MRSINICIISVMLLFHIGIIFIMIEDISMRSIYAQKNTQEICKDQIDNDGDGMADEECSIPNTSNDEIPAYNGEEILSDTFSAHGTISSLITDKENFTLMGNWNLNVSNGKVKNFIISIITSNFDVKSVPKIHAITNFQDSGDKHILLNSNGVTHFEGTVDITIYNNNTKWKNIKTVIIIDKAALFKIFLDYNTIDEHFELQPIKGIVGQVKSIDS